MPNRSNYIHWIEDLLSSGTVARLDGQPGDRIRGFDIGTGANCIYPLLGASLLGWSFVGSDVTDVALEWAQRNVKNNPHLLELIEIRKAGDVLEREEDNHSGEVVTNSEENTHEDSFNGQVGMLPSEEKSYQGPPVLVGVVRDGEKFHFCMCNPPFFESMTKAGLNPRTSCGGTYDEMVCPGGELAFITRIIEDSVLLKQSFQWFTSMVGRKANLKFLVTKLREFGVSIVKTTEFVQGHTCRWGLAWSFMQPTGKKIVSLTPEKNHQSFMLEGLTRQFGAIKVLKSVESFFLVSGASCKCELSLFHVDVTASKEHCNAIVKYGLQISDDNAGQFVSKATDCSSSMHCSLDELRFRVSVFEQIPGTLLVKGSLPHRQSRLSGLFLPIFEELEKALKKEFVDKCNRSCGTK